MISFNMIPQSFNKTTSLDNYHKVALMAMDNLLIVRKIDFGQDISNNPELSNFVKTKV